MHFRIPQFVWFLPLFLVGTGCSQGPVKTFDIVIQNGNLIDLVTGEIDQHDIFISDGRVIQMVPADSSIAFESGQIIDAEDRYILPGFWDNHVHFRGGDSLIEANQKFLPLFLANGITTVRDAGGDLTPSVMEWKKKIAAGRLDGPTIFTSGPKIDGPGASWAGSLAIENEGDIAIVLDSLQQIPVDFVKLYDSRISGENYLKAIAEAEKRGLISSGHMPFTVTLDATVGAGIDAIEHLYYIMKGCSANESEITQQLRNKEIGFWQAMPLLAKEFELMRSQLQESYQDSTAQKTFQSLKENKVYVVPTLHIGENLSYLDETDHSNDAYLKYMSDGIIQTYQGRIQRALNSSEKAIQDRKDLDKFFIRLTGALHNAGVGLLAGSDCGAFNSYTYPGISFHKELEALVRSGVPPLEALKTSAYNGSKFLKQDSDYGTIEVGKVSDLVLLERNPLEDIKNTQKIYAVVKGNTIYDSDKLGDLLKEVEKR